MQPPCCAPADAAQACCILGLGSPRGTWVTILLLCTMAALPAILLKASRPQKCHQHIAPCWHYLICRPCLCYSLPAVAPSQAPDGWLCIRAALPPPKCPPKPLPQGTAANRTDHSHGLRMYLGPQLRCSPQDMVTSVRSPCHRHAPGQTHSGCLQDYTTIYSTMKRIADAEPRDLDAWTISLTLGEPALCLSVGAEGPLWGFCLPDCCCLLLSLWSIS